MRSFGKAQARPTKGPPEISGGLHGAGDGIRTRDLLLGKEMLYQLSHSRKLGLRRAIVYHMVG